MQNKSISYAIYTSNWMAVSVKQRKNLLLVMMMSQKGRIISFYGACALIISSFTWVSLVKMHVIMLKAAKNIYNS